MDYKEYLKESKRPVVADTNVFPPEQKNIKGKTISAWGDESGKEYTVKISNNPKQDKYKHWRVVGILKKKGFAAKDPTKIGDEIKLLWHYGEWQVYE